MCICVCMPVHSCPQRLERDIASLMLQLQVTVSPSTWVLRTKLWFSARAARILNC